EDQIFEALAKHLGVEYIYTKTSFSSDHHPNKEITDHDLKTMAPEWINQLYTAALEADSNRVLELMIDIPDSEINLRQFLGKAVRLFQFEQIVDLTEALINHD
ncbi:MAG: hybrid sensor histidine kinase/response regulator, partial [Planktothrix sp.]